MHTKQTTKELLCDSIIDLLDRKPIKDITVRDITENCGVSLRSFYNHFKDREDLIFYVVSERIIRAFQSTPLDEPLYDALLTLLSMVIKNASFLLSAIKYEGQNNLLDIGAKAIKDILIERICSINKTSELDEKMQYAIDFWVNGFTKTGKELMASNDSLNPKEVLDKVIYATPQCLLPYFVGF